MSKIGKQPVTLPESVKAEITGHEITISGPIGEITNPFPQDIEVTMESSSITVKNKSNSKQALANWGTTRALIQNMVVGVQNGWSKQLEMEGAGYRAETSGDKITLTVGFSHPVEISAPEGVKFQVEKNIITVQGINKQAVGQAAANIKAIRPPDVYTGKGIKFVGEHIRRKPGKAAKSAEGGE